MIRSGARPADPELVELWARIQAPVPREPAHDRREPRGEEGAGARRRSRRRHPLDDQPPEHVAAARRRARLDGRRVRAVGCRHGAPRAARGGADGVKGSPVPSLDSARDGPGALHRGSRRGRGGERGPGAAVLELAYDTRAVVPGTLFFCVRGASARRARVRADRRVARRGRARRRAAGRRRRCRSSSCPTCAPRCPPPRRSSSATRPRELDVAAITGTNGKTTSAFLLHAILEADGRQAGLLTNIERRVGGERAADRAQHARGDRPAAALPRRWLDARRHRLRDGGDLDRAGAGAARRDAVRGARVHEPDAGPPRLPRLDGGVLRGEARAVRPGRARRRQRRRRVRPRGSRPSCPTRSRSTPTPPRSTGSTCGCRGRFNRENAIGAALAARALGVGDDAIRRGIESVRGRAGPVRADRRGAAVHGHRRLRAHARLARQRARAPRASSATGGSSSSSAPAATATATKRPLMGRVVAELADRRDPHLRQPALRGARPRSRPRSPPARSAGSRSSSTAAPRSSSRSATRSPATSS